MSITKAKHSKIRNTGLLFELLTRQITADILGGKDESAARDILFRCFGKDRELRKELYLYQCLLKENIRNQADADRLIQIVLEKRKVLDESKLKYEKFNLIREIKEKYSLVDFLKSNVKDYKSLASVYKLFESYNNHDTKFNIQEILQAKNTLVENMCVTKAEAQNSETNRLLEAYKKENESVRMLSYKILIDTFNKKYSVLNENQKVLLREYINNISNTNNLNDYVATEYTRLAEEIKKMNETIDSEVTKIKLNEICKQLEKTKPRGSVKDNHVMVLLLSYELLKEIQNAKK